MGSNLAEWEDAILGLAVEPCTGDLHLRATISQSTCWLNLLYDGLSVVVEFKLRAVMVDRLNLVHFLLFR